VAATVDETAPAIQTLVKAREPRTSYRDLDHRTKRFIKGSLLTIVASTILFVYVLPLLFMLTTSFKSEDQLANGLILPQSPRTAVIDGEEYELLQVEIDGEARALALVTPGRQQSTFVDPDDPGTEIVWEGSWRTLKPEYSFDPGFDNYPEAWRSTTPAMSRMIMNTFLIAGIGMTGTVIASTLVAYGLSRFRIPYKKLILASLLATIILPRFVTLVPTYVMYRWFGFIGTYVPLTLPHFFSNAYNVFLMRQFFLTIPRDLDEAAAIDGAGPFKTLITVILPQAKGAVLAIALFHFFFAWNDFFEPLVFLGRESAKFPLSVGLYQFLGIYDTNIPLVLSGAVIAMVVPLIVFVALQKAFLRGIDLSGSIK
jgi:multiple sugar transport system permease protein